MQYAVLIGVAAVVTLVVTPIVRALGTKWGIVAHPGGRHVHTGLIPRIGGVAMFAGFVAAVGVEYLGERFWGWPGMMLRQEKALLGTMLGIVLMFVIGVIDDIVELKPGQKFVGQLVAASVVVAFGVKINFVGNPFGGGIIMLGVLGVPITLLWIVGFANVINLIDGLDGLAAGVSGIAALTSMVIAQQSNVLVAGAMAAALLGACVGFLRYNFHPASIFMGDSGALFLGFTLACIFSSGRDEVGRGYHARGTAGDHRRADLRHLLRYRARRMGGKPIQVADKGHIHHRLLGRGSISGRQC